MSKAGVDINLAKILGGIGAVLVALSSMHWALGVIGIVLLLIVFKDFSEYYGKDEIFQNALKALMFGVVAIIIFGITLGSVVLTAFLRSGVLGMFAQIIICAVVVFVFYLLSAIFFRRCLDLLADVTGNSLFSTAGFLYLLGACLTVILVGAIVIIIAYVLLAVAFLTLR
ncbi:MAG: hypothetical protein DRZ82_08550 [Thermoprotei archaeon]|nr:MAG: hypothetical protein DRZ82_08550 [Thermoprotei archaeon]